MMIEIRDSANYHARLVYQEMGMQSRAYYPYGIEETLFNPYSFVLLQVRA